LLAVLMAPLAFYAFVIEPASLRLARYDIALEQAPDLRGLRIAVISDLHGGAPFIDDAKIAQVVAMTNAARPDLILLTGDLNAHIYFRRGMPIGHVIDQLRPLAAPLGVYAVIGNHDRWEGASRVTALLTRAGVPVLENASRLVRTRRGGFYLVGIGDAEKHADDPARALSGVPRGADALCFTHSPDSFPRLPATCALTIAGHTHGGQVKLPLLGRPVVPSHYHQRYAAGLVREGGRTLFVSTGIGTSILPVRLGVPPEIALITVR
jgi:predicted MPP superfamily phosphohydrolase